MPFGLTCEVQETEHRLPSLRFDIELVIRHSTGKFMYNAQDIWIACGDFDRFVDGLTRVTESSAETATLYDLSSNFALMISMYDDKYLVEMTVREPEFNFPDCRLTTKSQISRDTARYILNQFVGMPRWW